MKRNIFMATAAVVLTVAVVSCSGKEQWKVEATVDGASGKTVFLESVQNGVWSVLDSAVVAGNGVFSFVNDRVTFPEIYRLTIDGRSLYFPIDSVETITVETALDRFDTDYRLAGSRSAEMMQAVNEKVAEAVRNAGASSVADNEDLKRAIAEILQQDWSNIAAYYTINRSVGSTQLFDPARPLDLRIINAVANMFMTQRPDDPRTNLLKNRSLEMMRIYGSSQGQTVYAQEVLFPEVSGMDRDGKSRNLSDEWAKGKCIILNFTALTASEAVPYNVALNGVYEKYRDLGVEIVQVSCDNDEFAWSAAAKNIPWVSLYNTPAQASENLAKYNVVTLPATFVIDRKGDRMERVDEVSELDGVIAKML